MVGAQVWVGGGPNTSDISIFGTDGMFVRTLSTGASAAAIAVVAGQVWVGGGTNTSGISRYTSPTDDTVSGLIEEYTNANAGSNKTLSVSAYTVNAGDGGNDYTVTLVTITTGLINPAPLTITATTNTKTYDSTTMAAASPSVSGLIGQSTR